MKLILIPIRFIVLLLVFSPLLLIAAVLVKIGEIIAEQAEYFEYRLKEIAKDWSFLTSEKERKKAEEAMNENKLMEFHIKLLQKKTSTQTDDH